MLETKEQKKLFTINGFLVAYEVSRSTFYSEVNKGKLKIRKLNSRTMIRLEDAENWKNALENPEKVE